MPVGPRWPIWQGRAIRLLRLALPVCLVAAALVAGQGLLRVVGRPAASPSTPAAPSLELGSKVADSTALAAHVPSPAPARPSPTPAPVTRKPAPAPVPVVVSQPVAVFNASRVSGLARRTAAALREHGITVAAIGNLELAHRPGAGTVFYAPGQSGQARVLASVAGAAAVAPAPGWLRTQGRLVLVVTDTNPALTRS